MAGKQLQEKDGDILTERGRQQDVRWKRQHAEQTDELYKKGKKKSTDKDCAWLCVYVFV